MLFCVFFFYLYEIVGVAFNDDGNEKKNVFLCYMLVVNFIQNYLYGIFMGKEETFEGSYRINYFSSSVIHILRQTLGFYKLRLTTPNDPNFFIYFHDNVAAFSLKST